MSAAFSFAAVRRLDDQELGRLIGLHHELSVTPTSPAATSSVWDVFGREVGLLAGVLSICGAKEILPAEATEGACLAEYDRRLRERRQVVELAEAA